MIENLIVPVLNRYDLLQRMLNSVDVPVDHLLIIDNGASLQTALTLDLGDNFKKVTHLPMPANLGVSGSWNLGIKSFPYAQRWFIVSNDVVFEPGALEKLSQARRDEITLTGAAPHWQAFALGDEAVSDIGLFDESLFPAYFEDNDYSRRAEFVGVNIRLLDLKIRHDNSSTIKAGYIEKNAVTYSKNEKHYQSKMDSNDYSAGSWSLDIRRENGWE
jgi:glycosyltransferase involved in cell wall biosynthesis